MTKFLKNLSKSWMFSAVASMALGLVLLLLPGISTKIVGYVLGALAIAFGVGRAVKYFQQKHIYPVFFRGDLDDVYVFEGALNRMQIEELMMRNKAPGH